MRVLHVGKYYPPVAGGVEVFTADLCRAQVRRGHAVQALVHDREAGQQDDAGVEVVRAAVLGELLFTPVSPGFRGALSRAIGDFRPDVIHAHVPNPSALWLLTLPAARAIPCVLHWHSDIVASTLDRRLAIAYRAYRPFERRLLARSSRVIATSPPYLESSAELAPYRERCRVVPLGIDIDRFAMDAQVAPSWPGSGTRRVLAVGRLTYYKGFDRLVEAVSRIDASLVIVGGGADEAALRALAREHGCEDRVRIVAQADDSERDAWLASCDVLCQPSLERTEAFGVVLLEAFAFGKPVVASDLEGSGAPWVVEACGGGLLAPTGDVAALAGRLDELLAAPDRAAAFGAAGRATLRERFTIDAVAAAVDAVYAECVGASPST